MFDLLLKAGKNFLDSVFGEQEIGKIGKNMLAIIFLVVAVSISFKEISMPTGNWFFAKEKTLTFFPDLLSGVIGLGLIAPLYGRRLIKWNVSFYSILYFICAVALFSTMVSLALFGGNQSILTQGLIGVSLILSWAGLRELAGFSWLFCFAAVVINLFMNNIALGFYGFTYVICGFLGILLNTELNPAELIQAFKDEYTGLTNTSIVEQAKEDIQTAKDRVV